MLYDDDDDVNDIIQSYICRLNHLNIVYDSEFCDEEIKDYDKDLSYERKVICYLGKMEELKISNIKRISGRNTLDVYYLFY